MKTAPRAAARPSLTLGRFTRIAVGSAAALATVIGTTPAAAADDETDLAPVTEPESSRFQDQSVDDESLDDESAANEGAADEGAGEDENSDAEEEGVSEEQRAAGEGDAGSDEQAPRLLAESASIPVLQDDPGHEVIVGTSTLLDVLANDDVDGEILSIDVMTWPQYGSVSPYGELGPDFRFQYRPQSGAQSDSFTYTVTTAAGTSEPATVSVTAVEDEVTPDFGQAKYRVGVRIADGSYVAPGTTPEGAKLQLVTTMYDGTVVTATCDATSLDGDTAFCADEDGDIGKFAPYGATITITQLTAAPGLEPSPATLLVPACPDDESGGPACTVEGADFVFENTGPRPVTRNDSATTQVGESVDIDVLANDESDDPATLLEIDNQPANGTAEVIGAPETPPSPAGRAVLFAVGGGTQAVRYTPHAGFSGTDTFTYRVSNSNGSRTGTVTVRVVGGQVVDSDDSDSTPTAAPNDVLPNTGGAGLGVLGWALGLLGAGGALIAGGRTRLLRRG